MSLEEIRQRFAQIVALDDEEINLAEAALLIAAEEYPRLDIELYMQKLDRFGDLVREKALYARDAIDIITALNTTFFDELGFAGNRASYYDPRNSFLNQVIDRRTGIPITLSLVYIEVAKRIGFPVKGVGFPGHFIVKYRSEDQELYIDPFNGGKVMGEFGCAEMLAELSGGKLKLMPEHLAAVSSKQILMRMLSNLLSIYAGADHPRALAAIERILLINPASTPHIRDHGLLLAAVGKSGEAIAEMERYLTLAPAAKDGDSIREQIKSVRQNQAQLN